MEAYVEASGPRAMADRDVCIAVGEDLARHYPDYPWRVGCNHEAGTIVIDLGVPKPLGMANMGMLLHIGAVLGPGGQSKVMRAGGELLERFGLSRAKRQEDMRDIAAEHGLDAGNAILKSRY